MASVATGAAQSERDRLKPGFLVVLAVCMLAVFWVDDRFWFSPSDPHYRRVAAYLPMLAVHGVCGLTALVTGTLQMSRRIRTRRPALHRRLGAVYLAAVALSAPIALIIGISPLEPASIHVQQVFQAGLWLASAGIAWRCAKLRLMTLHRDWMIRSYAFTLVFVTSRLPDLVWDHYSDQFVSDLLWSLILIALLVPDAINLALALRRGRG